MRNCGVITEIMALRIGARIGQPDVGQKINLPGYTKQ